MFHLYLAGFSIEFCTAVPVVVTGITAIQKAKKVVYIMHVERRHLQEAWAPMHKFNMVAIFQRCGDVKKRLCGHSVVC